MGLCDFIFPVLNLEWDDLSCHEINHAKDSVEIEGKSQIYDFYIRGDRLVSCQSGAGAMTFKLPVSRVV